MIVLDTHAWLWWTLADDRLSASVREAARTDEIGICSISCQEIARLASRGRLALDRDPAAWIRRALAPEQMRMLPLDADTAIDAGLLDHDRFPGDPADRIIYATARRLRARLATADRRIRAFDPALTLW